MAELGVVQVGIEGDWDGFSRKFRKSMDDLGSGMFSGSGITRSLESFGGRITGIIGGALKGVAIGVGGITAALGVMALKGGLQRAMTIDAARVQLRRMGFELEEIDGLVKTVQDTFDGTIFTTPEGFQLTNMLIGAGVQLEEIPGYLRVISDAAAHGNVPLAQMADVFLKIETQGKLTGEELRRLAIAGVPLEAIANELGVTTSKMREMVSEGKITSDVFFEAISNVEMLAGAAKASGDTVSGAFTNVRSNLARLGEAFLSPLFGENGPLVVFFKSIRSLIRELIPSAGSLGERFAEWVIPALEGMSRVSSALSDFKTGWVSAHQEMGAPVALHVSQMHAYGEAAREVFDRVSSAIQTAIGWYREHEELIRKIAAAVLPAAAAVAAFAKTITVVRTALILLTAATPVGIILALTAAIIYAWQNSEKFREVVKQVFETIKNVVTTVIETVIGWFDRFQGVNIETSDWVKKTWEQIKGIFMTAWEIIKWVFNQIVSHIRGAIEAIRGVIQIFVDWGKWIWEHFGEAIMGLVRRTWEFIKSTITNFLTVIQGILDVILGVITGNWKKAWDGLVGIVTGVWNQIKNVFTNLIGSVIGFGRDIVMGLWNGIKSMGSWIVEKVKAFVKSIIPGPIASILGISSPSRLMMEYGRNVGEGLAVGLLDSHDDVVAASERLAAAATISGSAALDASLEGADQATLMPIINHFHAPVGGDMGSFAREIERQRALEVRFSV